jgi:hypothetical protein
MTEHANHIRDAFACFCARRRARFRSRLSEPWQNLGTKKFLTGLEPPLKNMSQSESLLKISLESAVIAQFDRNSLEKSTKIGRRDANGLFDHVAQLWQQSAVQRRSYPLRDPFRFC